MTVIINECQIEGNINFLFYYYYFMCRYEMIAKLVPDDYQKQLSHIRKMEARKARKKKIGDEDDDDSEPSFKNKTSEE